MPQRPVSATSPAGSEPPSNPGLRTLIQRKRESNYAPDDRAQALGFRGWHERGYLPHFDAPNVTQFLTFNLYDAFPVERRAEWEAFLRPPAGARNSFRESKADATRSRNKFRAPDKAADAAPLGFRRRVEAARLRNKFRAPAAAADAAPSEFRRRIEAWLDRGHGECWLQREDVATRVEEKVLAGHDRDYALRAWVIMPNHVHLVVDVWQTPLSRLVKRWKGATSTTANRLIGRAGHFWQEDYFDTLIRDAEHRTRAIRYVENNPTKAKLAPAPEGWRWSSARRRDQYGRLVL